MNVAELIREHEGLSLKMYICPAGKRTIGYGHNLDDVPISQRAADAILDADIARCGAQLGENLPWFAMLDEVRQAAMIDLCFNLGWQGLGRFRRFLAAMAQSTTAQVDYQAAALELTESKWYGQVGQRGQRIVQMIKTGEWP